MAVAVTDLVTARASPQHVLKQSINQSIKPQHVSSFSHDLPAKATGFSWCAHYCHNLSQGIAKISTAAISNFILKRINQFHVNTYLKLSGPDVTYAVDWALKANYLSTPPHPVQAGLQHTTSAESESSTRRRHQTSND